MYAALDLLDEMQLERVDFSAVPKNHSISYKLQEVLYRTKVEMELSFIEIMLSKPILITEAEEYMNILEKRRYWQKILELMNENRFCPEPPGGVKMTEQTLWNGRKYCKIRSLWDLMHMLNLSSVGDESLRWQEVYYLPEGSHNHHWNRTYLDYNERGREFIMTEYLYYVEEIGRWIMVESCYDSF